MYLVEEHAFIWVMAALEWFGLVILKAAISRRAAALRDVKDNVLGCFFSTNIAPEDAV